MLYSALGVSFVIGAASSNGLHPTLIVIMVKSLIRITIPGMTPWCTVMSKLMAQGVVGARECFSA